VFEGLDDIKWEQFGDTHIAIGMKTREIPDCVRNMIHPDHEEREFAIACLLGEGQHLGMLGQATPRIIPYVLEVLSKQDYEQRGYLMMGLALMFDTMFRYDSFRYLRLSLQTYDEIKQGYPLYKRLLDDAETEVRLFTVKVMTYMQDDSMDALSTLLVRLSVEEDSEVRIEIIRGMLRLHKAARLFATEAWQEARQKIMSLYNYLKENGSFDEQVYFAHAFRDIETGFYDKDINTFVEQTLTRADSPPTTD